MGDPDSESKIQKYAELKLPNRGIDGKSPYMTALKTKDGK